MRLAVQTRLLGSLLLLGTADAFGLGLGRVSTLSHLGNPLELSVGISAEISDGLTAECVNAEVFVGEQRLANELVRIRINRAPDGTPISVRLVTGTRIDEPVATVTLMLGCPTSVTRRYVVFIDPPALSLAQAGGVDATSETETTQPAPSVAESRGGRSASVRSRTPAPAVAAAPQPSGATDSERGAMPPLRRGVDEEGSRSAAQVARNRRLAATPATAASAAAPNRMAAEPGARLRLESAPALQGGSPAREQSAQARSGAASAAAASASAIAELTAQVNANSLALDQERLRVLEERFRRLRTENDATKRALADLESGLKAAQSDRFDKQVVYGLAAAVVLLLLALLVTLARLLSRRSSAAWADGDSSGSADGRVDRTDFEQPSPAPVGEAVGSAPPVQALLPEPARPDPVVDDGDAAWHSAGAAEEAVVPPDVRSSGDDAVGSPDRHPLDQPQTMPGPAYGAAANTAPDRAGLPIDELIDLEQQADFFIVLGQDDAAVELLTAHVQTTGDASPLPYLKLLEIYRRNGEQTAYTRTRERFNRRFGATAPEWEDDPVAGRPVDEYPEVVHRLQAAWPLPARALELLESLLFRRDPSVAEFDLPAYGELLFLYSLARDLSEREVPQSEVDLLLPLEGDAAAPASLDFDLALDAPAEEPLPAEPAVLDFNLRLLDAPIIPPSIAASTESSIESDSPLPSRSAR